MNEHIQAILDEWQPQRIHVGTAAEQAFYSTACVNDECSNFGGWLLEQLAEARADNGTECGLPSYQTVLAEAETELRQCPDFEHISGLRNVPSMAKQVVEELAAANIELESLRADRVLAEAREAAEAARENDDG